MILDICRDMEEVCPDAWLINFTNPAGIAKVRQFSLEIWIMSWEIMEAEKVPLVLIGSVFRTRSPYLLEPYLSAVHEVCPAAYLVLVDKAPVMGAIRIARKMTDAKGA